ncbi:hypothetical protein [Leptospira sp. id769339]|uniref:hypothetical protein n=1 Tax=Leptospira sp. id769339 TaxID=2864221 RepID=UPI00214C0868|nr:hypothetical protein [Leptospira sp. id769339]MCR1794894.1 hypothetical protein [Leptospira sp. id769339]
MNIDHNTLFYTFSTMAQVLAAILAVTAVFVFAKSSEFRVKMQREMGNVVKVLDSFPQFEEWRIQATKAERHGVIPEMKSIFGDRFKGPDLGPEIKEACKYGLFNSNLNDHIFMRFAKQAYCGLLLIGLLLVAISFTSETNVIAFPTISCVCLELLTAFTLYLLVSIARLIHFTTQEKIPEKYPQFLPEEHV